VFSSRTFLPFVFSHFYPEWFKHRWSENGQRLDLKEPVPHNFDVTKGSTHMAVTREFVEFAVNDSRAKDLLRWMQDIKIPDEHFFQTLNHNPQMDIPGSYLGINLLTEQRCQIHVLQYEYEFTTYSGC